MQQAAERTTGTHQQFVGVEGFGWYDGSAHACRILDVDASGALVEFIEAAPNVPTSTRLPLGEVELSVADALARFEVCIGPAEPKSDSDQAEEKPVKGERDSYADRLDASRRLIAERDQFVEAEYAAGTRAGEAWAIEASYDQLHRVAAKWAEIGYVRLRHVLPYAVDRTLGEDFRSFWTDSLGLEPWPSLAFVHGWFAGVTDFLEQLPDLN